jgi:hypothetical protein
MGKRQPWPNIRYLGICLDRADPSGRAVLDVGLRPLACWDCGFESSRGHGCHKGCGLSGRGLCDELISRPEESY